MGECLAFKTLFPAPPEAAQVLSRALGRVADIARTTKASNQIWPIMAGISHCSERVLTIFGGTVRTFLSANRRLFANRTGGLSVARLAPHFPARTSHMLRLSLRRVLSNSLVLHPLRI